MNAPMVIILAMLCALASLAYSALLSLGLRQPANQKMQAVATALQEGPRAFAQQTQTLIFIGAGLFLLIWAVLDGFRLPYTALCFAVGASLAMLAGMIGLKVSRHAQVRTAQDVEKGLSQAFDTAFKGAAATGLAVTALGLLGIGTCYLLCMVMGVDTEHFLKYIIGFGFGASLVSLFVRFGTDLFETHAVTLIASMLLGYFAFKETELITRAIFYPMALAAAALLAAGLATWFVKLPRGGLWGGLRVISAIYQGLAATALLSALAFYFITRAFFPENFMGFYLDCLTGLGLMMAITLITEYYTSARFKPVRWVAEQSRSGVALHLISGLAVGFQSTLGPILVICLGLLAAYGWAGGNPEHPLLGMYGVAVAATAMLSGSGILIAIDAFGPITDHATGIARLAGLTVSQSEVTDALKAAGSRTKAIARGYAIGSAGLAALVLFACYIQGIEAFRAALNVKPLQYLLSEPLVLIGLLLGGVLPFFFSALFMNPFMHPAGKAASQIRLEIKRQFDEVPDLLEETSKPEQGHDSIGTVPGTLPGLLVVLTPLGVGLTLGPLSLSGLLVGLMLSGLLLAIFTATAGAIWSQTKNYIELGYIGGKGSEAHQAALVGDAVAEPFKDLAGLALNPMIKIINIVSLLVISRIAGGSLFGL